MKRVDLRAFVRPFRGLQGLRLGALASLALLGTSCEDNINYGYFSVKVTLTEAATPEYLARINACGANVTGADEDFSSLNCALGHVSSRDLGTFEWSTSATGKVKFTVRLTDVTQREIGIGMSEEVAIVPGSTVITNVVVTPTVLPMM
jgi:hypothetical protein